MDNLEKQSGHFGWGLPEQTPAEISSSEARAFQDFANVMSRKIMRQPAKSIKNMELTTKIVKLQEEDGIEEGFSFLHLEKALFGQEIPRKPQLIGSCNPPTNLIRMADGTNKPIIEIKLFDRVLTAEGNIGTVTHLMGREADEPMFKIALWGHYGLEVTGEHPVLTKRGYVKASEITEEDFVCIPKYVPNDTKVLQTEQYVLRNGQMIRLSKDKPVGSRSVGVGGDTSVRKTVSVYRTIPDIISLNRDFGRLCGFYLAEGNSDTNKLVFTFNIDERNTFVQEVYDLWKNLFGVEAVINEINHKSTCKVTVHSTLWAQLFKNIMGTGSGQKHLSSELASANSEFLEGLRSAWIDGDGYYSNDHSYLGTTVSKRLALDIFGLSAGLNLKPNINSAHQKISHGVKTRQRHYNISYLDSDRKIGLEDSEKALWRKVRKVTQRDYKGKVYNFEVSGDNSYVADGVGCHNCVASGGLIVDTQRMLAEVFIFNEAQDLMGTTVAGINSFQPFGPFNYRLGRSYVGLNGGRASGADDGSLCAPHFRGKMEVGFLPCNAEGLQSDDYPEPQNVATYRLWGANDTLVNQFKSKVICKLTETEKVITADDVKTLICVHLKPLQICSMWAFEAGSQHSSWRWGGQPVTIYRRSRQQWAHNLSVVGCVKVKGSWYVIIQNTWGNMHNGRSWFPITLETMDQWLKDRDTECMSNGNFSFNEDLPPAVQ